ncbi:bifunctional DNA primase/polymerase-like protein [Thermosporothrix hazakensis]|uniref:Bifunctional DNA primase/polymerase-like protein n=2 Tax=Thermosporothrix TaxID=768650 RepID=A0A326UBI6_THEHA|nr:bifunctional DNA primase/polymerase [Thermosporothrix hazakensis]PZW25371.1 bifunctional DNA primase/polymerase-like protein [Thermosporothrix hazakensis]BBH87214.1 hypothetical protein KTC_19650 [Thermosporothrix sp. COM3]GCE50603.1 hypothetical protein KTH_54720 [Thermosporothrix hazakensis]
MFRGTSPCEINHVQSDLVINSGALIAFPHTCREAAFFYARRGLPVFPVNGKVPYPRTRGFHEATTDAEQISWWWRRWPEANVAIPTGSPSGWTVLDIDGRHDGFASLRHLQAMLQHRLLDLHQAPYAVLATRTAHTGSGRHLVFRSPEEPVLCCTVQFVGLPGIDLRGEGGYIVVPPSLHPNGRHYRWHSFAPIAPFPSLLLDLVRQRERFRCLYPRQDMPLAVRGGLAEPSQLADPAYWLERALQRARVGTRHTCALWLACRLIQQARLTPAQAEPYLRAYAARVPGGGHDYPVSDALRCLSWAHAQLS